MTMQAVAAATLRASAAVAAAVAMFQGLHDVMGQAAAKMIEALQGYRLGAWQTRHKTRQQTDTSLNRSRATNKL
jgi:hypothetical protein